MEGKRQLFFYYGSIPINACRRKEGHRKDHHRKTTVITAAGRMYRGIQQEELKRKKSAQIRSFSFKICISFCGGLTFSNSLSLITTP